MKYQLTLQDSHGVRTAIYDPHLSTLFWDDNGHALVDKSSEGTGHFEHPVASMNPENGVGKTKALRKIKIQMGFACNYTCTYCSQNNQRAFSKDTALQTLEKVDAFLAKMPKWFDGGSDGKGRDVALEFWGGETLLYWDAVLKMAQILREKFPNIGLALFTNGSIVTKDMADQAARLRLHFIVSHDGPTFSEDRSKDPFDIPAQAESLHYLFNKLSPLHLISFNATVSPKNHSMIEIRKYIADKLRVETKKVIVTYDLATPYDSHGLSYVTQVDKRKSLINSIFDDLLARYPFDMSLGMADVIVHDFFESLAHNRESKYVGQKCHMDQPTSLAVDLDGNVLTCQNVTAKGGHKIGHVDQYEEVSLNTAYHWSSREECVNCPVVQICKGSCMFLKDNLWKAACDQHFTWSLAYLAFALYVQTGYRLIEISGDVIRRQGDTKIEVLEQLNEKLGRAGA